MKWGALVIPGEARAVYFLIAAAVFLSAALARLELRRPNRRRLKLRVAMSILSVLSLLLMALQPRWLSPPKSGGALLITPGADLETVRAVADSIDVGPLVFSFDGSEKWKSIFQNVEAIPDAAYLKRHHPEIRRLHVAGHGLRDDDWHELDSVAIELHPSPLLPGIKHGQWSREIFAGQRLHVQGTLAGSAGGDNTLYLEDPGGVVDSVRVTKPGEAAFQLSAVPHESGKFLYNVFLRSPDRQILFNENIDVTVVEPRPLKVLVFESSPRFETRHLKNWLGKHRGAMAIRSVISRGRHRFEYLNHPRVDLSTVTSRLLRDFDLVMIDGKTLRALSPAERRVLRSAVEREGLGALIVPDENAINDQQHDFSNHEFFLDFRFEEFPDLDHRLVKPTWPGLQDSVITEIPAEPLAIKNDWGMKPLINDEMERLLAAAYQRGLGLVGISLIRDSYRWVLEGNTHFHAAYWSHLLAELARKEAQRERWMVASAQPALVDQPVQLMLFSRAARPIGLVMTEEGKQDSVFLQQDTIDPQRGLGTFWPRQSGWHRVSTSGAEPFGFYVYEKDHWQTWQQAQKAEATKRHALRNPFVTSQFRDRTSTQSKAVPLFYFFLLFLLSSAYLWIEKKL